MPTLLFYHTRTHRCLESIAYSCSNLQTLLRYSSRFKYQSTRTTMIDSRLLKRNVKSKIIKTPIIVLKLTENKSFVLFLEVLVNFRYISLYYSITWFKIELRNRIQFQHQMVLLNNVWRAFYVPYGNHITNQNRIILGV